MAEEATEVYVKPEYLDAMINLIVANARQHIVIPELPETEEEAQAAITDMFVLGPVVIGEPIDDANSGDRVIIVQPVPRRLALRSGTAKAVALLDNEYKLIYAVLLEEEISFQEGQPVSINNWCIRRLKPVSGCEIPEP